VLHVNIKNNDVTTKVVLVALLKSTFCSVVKFVFEVSVSVNLTYVK